MSEPAVPLDAAAERNLRRLKAVVIILGVLIVAGLIALVAGIVWRSSRAARPEVVGAEVPTAAIAPTATLPLNGSVTDMDLDGNRILLRVRSQEGEELIIYDAANGQIVTRIELKRTP